MEAATSKKSCKPLRLFLLGTAGTGKTRAIKTLLQCMQNQLTNAGFSLNFIRCAAPTGSAAFNLRFSATTIHRLIHWFNPNKFRQMEPGSTELARFQSFLQDTKMILIDEVSMVGRQFMGKIDARLKQGKAGAPGADESLGGLSCVCVGDPAQCEAMKDQQLYDVTPHKDTGSEQAKESARFSNIGLSVYDEFEDVIILSTVHRLRFIEKPNMSQEDIDYNDRATRFMNTLHKLRDLRWKLEDYFWLCKRKRSMSPPSERTRFTDAPYIMDFRRDTETNPEDNCNFFTHVLDRRVLSGS